MIVEMAGGLVQGGWNAIDNIIKGIGKGASYIGSAFFPAQQREQVKHVPIQSAVSTGQTYREIDPENQAMLEQAWYTKTGYIDMAEAEKKALSQAIGVQPKKEDWLGDSLEYAIRTGAQIKTIADLFDTKTREPITESPRTVYNVQQPVNREPETSTIGKVVGWISQVKGLFSQGFEGPEGSQFVIPVTHELDVTKKTTIIMAVIAAVIITILLLKRK